MFSPGKLERLMRQLLPKKAVAVCLLSFLMSIAAQAQSDDGLAANPKPVGHVLFHEGHGRGDAKLTLAGSSTAGACGR